MTTLHLMVACPAVASWNWRALPALRLSADDLQLSLSGDDMADHNARHGAVEVALWPLALQALRAGAEAILDFGFWSRTERDIPRPCRGAGFCLPPARPARSRTGRASPPDHPAPPRLHPDRSRPCHQCRAL
jgi:hypothetical protein